MPQPRADSDDKYTEGMIRASIAAAALVVAAAGHGPVALPPPPRSTPAPAARSEPTTPVVARSDATTPVAAAPAPSPQYVASNRIILSFASNASERIYRVEPWVSTDGGERWTPADARRISEHSLRFEAPADGRYDFFLVIESAAGRSSDPPAQGAAPHASIIVDTAPPTLQVHRATATLAPGDPPRAALRFDVTLRDEHLSDGGVRVFFRPAATLDAFWNDGGGASVRGDVIDWSPPPDAPSRIDVRVVAIDRAGNRAMDEVGDVAIPATAADSRSDDPQAADGSAIAPDRDEHPPPTEPPAASAAASPARDAPPTPARPPAANPSKLRRLAEMYREMGLLALAVARLEEALAAEPDDLAARLALGELHAQLGRLDDARCELETVLSRDPDAARARDALASVAMTQRRYAEARRLLRAMLEASPDDAQAWLRLGDAESCLGNRDEAIAAWRRAAAGPATDDSTAARARERLRLVFTGPRDEATER